MESIVLILSLVAVVSIAALVMLLKRMGNVEKRCHGAEREVGSLKEDLSDIRTAASQARRDLEKSRRELKASQEELKEARRKAFKAQRRAEKQGFQDADQQDLVRRWQEAAAAAQADVKRLGDDNARLVQKLQTLKERPSGVKVREAPADGGGDGAGGGQQEAVQAMKDLDGQIEQERRNGRRLAELDEKCARMAEKNQRLMGDLESLRRQVREKDAEVLVNRKKAVTAERSFLMLERDMELLTAQIAEDGKEALDGYPVEHAGQPLPASTLEEGEGRQGRSRRKKAGTRRQGQDDQGGGVDTGDAGGQQAGDADAPAEDN